MAVYHYKVDTANFSHVPEGGAYFDHVILHWRDRYEVQYEYGPYPFPQEVFFFSAHYLRDDHIVVGLYDAHNDEILNLPIEVYAYEEMGDQRKTAMICDWSYSDFVYARLLDALRDEIKKVRYARDNCG